MTAIRVFLLQYFGSGKNPPAGDQISAHTHNTGSSSSSSRILSLSCTCIGYASRRFFGQNEQKSKKIKKQHDVPLGACKSPPPPPMVAEYIVLS